MVQPSDHIEIASKTHVYQVVFDSDVKAAVRLAMPSDKRTFFIVDSEVIRTHEDLKTLDGEEIFEVKAVEANKTIRTVEQIAEWLLTNGADKSAHLVGIGGGIVQDLATFVSHIYYRGISWSYLPTTLLGMCDSCIGGKCALNLKGFKNQLGVIHPPSKIVISTAFLETLPRRHILSGYGEMLKLSLTSPHHFFERFVRSLDSEGFNLDDVARDIRSSLESKKWVIERDEYEGDLRRILNYGHSFGHAIEAASKNQISHGEAIVLGMDLMNFIGVKNGLTDPKFEDQFRRVAKTHFGLEELLLQVRPLKAQLVPLLKRDKKVQFGKIHFAFAKKPGELEIHPFDLDEDLEMIVDSYF